MSLFRNIIVLYICIGMAMYFGGFETPMSSFINSGGSFDSLVNGLLASFGFSAEDGFNIEIGTLPLVIVAIVAGGGFAFPVLIAVIVASMLIPLFTYPIALGATGMPPEFQTVYSIMLVLLQFLFTLGLVDWIRGEMN